MARISKLTIAWDDEQDPDAPYLTGIIERDPELPATVALESWTDVEPLIPDLTLRENAGFEKNIDPRAEEWLRARQYPADG